MHFRICANEIKTSTLATLAPWTSWLCAPRVARRFLQRTDVSVPPLWTSLTPGFLRPFPRRGPRLRAPLHRPRHAPGHGGRKTVRRACACQVYCAAYKREGGCVGARSPRPSRRARRPSATIEQPPTALQGPDQKRSGGHRPSPRCRRPTTPPPVQSSARIGHV
jgi:hypothetical protein